MTFQFHFANGSIHYVLKIKNYTQWEWFNITISLILCEFVVLFSCFAFGLCSPRWGEIRINIFDTWFWIYIFNQSLSTNRCTCYRNRRRSWMIWYELEFYTQNVRLSMNVNICKPTDLRMIIFLLELWKGKYLINNMLSSSIFSIV